MTSATACATRNKSSKRPSERKCDPPVTVRRCDSRERTRQVKLDGAVQIEFANGRRDANRGTGVVPQIRQGRIARVTPHIACVEEYTGRQTPRDWQPEVVRDREERMPAQRPPRRINRTSAVAVECTEILQAAGKESVRQRDVGI